jgi:hypothetical protein
LDNDSQNVFELVGCIFVVYDKEYRKIATIDGQAVSPTSLTETIYTQLTRQNSELTCVVLIIECQLDIYVFA